MIRTKRGSLSSAHLDIARGVAALLVYIGHWRGLFFVRYQDCLLRGPLTAAMYAATSSGRKCVMVFFVLSGFLIATSIVQAMASGRWSWGVYLRNRLTRLYVVLVPALLLTALWDHLGFALAGTKGIYAGSHVPYAIMWYDVPSRSGIGTFLGSLFYLQQVWAPHRVPHGLLWEAIPEYGSNVPLWSLSHEFWYYMAFPALLVALRRGATPRARLLCGLAGVAMLVLVRGQIALYFLVWLMGAAVSIAPPVPRRLRVPATVACFVAFAAAMAIPPHGVLFTQKVVDFLNGITFTGVVHCILSAEDRPAPPRYLRVSQVLAGSSYTLYLVHVPVLVLANALMVNQVMTWQPDAHHLLTALPILILVPGYALLLAHFTEARTDQFRRWIERLTARPAAVAAQDAKER